MIFTAAQLRPAAPPEQSAESRLIHVCHHRSRSGHSDRSGRPARPDADLRLAPTDHGHRRDRILLRPLRSVPRRGPGRGAGPAVGPRHHAARRWSSPRRSPACSSERNVMSRPGRPHRPAPRVHDQSGQSYSVLSISAGFSPNLTFFVVLRFLAGVGIGAELVLVDTYLAEFLPGRVRGRLHLLGLRGRLPRCSGRCADRGPNRCAAPAARSGRLAMAADRRRSRRAVRPAGPRVDCRNHHAGWKPTAEPQKPSRWWRRSNDGPASSTGRRPEPAPQRVQGRVAIQRRASRHRSVGSAFTNCSARTTGAGR